MAKAKASNKLFYTINSDAQTRPHIHKLLTRHISRSSLFQINSSLRLKLSNLLKTLLSLLKLTKPPNIYTHDLASPLTPQSNATAGTAPEPGRPAHLNR